MAQPSAPGWRDEPKPLLLGPISQRDALLDLLMIAGFFALVQLLIVVGVTVDAPSLNIADVPAVLNVAAIFWSAGLICFFSAALVRFRGQPLAAIGLSLQAWPRMVPAGLGSFFVLLGCMIFGNLLLPIPESATPGEENAERIMQMLPQRLSPLWIVVFSLTIGFYEELLFRGLLMPRLRRLTHSWVAAVVISTAVFMLMHAPMQTSVAVVYIGGLSLLLSLLTIGFGSILPAVILHAAWDMFQFFVLYGMMRG